MIKNKEKINKGEGEYVKCQRCKKRFRRKKSFWNIFSDGAGYLFCPKCNESFNKWWDEIKSK